MLGRGVGIKRKAKIAVDESGWHAARHRTQARYFPLIPPTPPPCGERFYIIDRGRLRRRRKLAEALK